MKSLIFLVLIAVTGHALGCVDLTGTFNLRGLPSAYYKITQTGCSEVTFAWGDNAPYAYVADGVPRLLPDPTNSARLSYTQAYFSENKLIVNIISLQENPAVGSTSRTTYEIKGNNLLEKDRYFDNKGKPLSCENPDGSIRVCDGYDFGVGADLLYIRQ